MLGCHPPLDVAEAANQSVARKRPHRQQDREAGDERPANRRDAGGRVPEARHELANDRIRHSTRRRSDHRLKPAARRRQWSGTHPERIATGPTDRSADRARQSEYPRPPASRRRCIAAQSNRENLIVPAGEEERTEQPHRAAGPTVSKLNTSHWSADAGTSSSWLKYSGGMCRAIRRSR